MSNVVDRLRIAQRDCNGAGQTAAAILMQDAIAEIERLTATIEQLRQVAGAASLDGGLVNIKADLAKKKENPSHG